MSVLVRSAATAVQFGTQPPMGSWWQRDLFDPSNSIPLFIDGDQPFTGESDVSQAAFQAIGRRDYVVVSDVAQLEKFSFYIQCFKEDFDKFEATRISCNTCLLSADNGRSYYIRYDTRTFTIINTTDEYYSIQVAAIQVARPSA